MPGLRETEINQITAQIALIKGGKWKAQGVMRPVQGKNFTFREVQVPSFGVPLKRRCLPLLPLLATHPVVTLFPELMLPLVCIWVLAVHYSYRWGAKMAAGLHSGAQRNDRRVLS